MNRFWHIFLLCLLVCSCSINNSQLTIEEISQTKSKVAPFFKPMLIQPYDWLETFPENGQTFEQYQTANPTLPTPERNTIYIQPIGEFSETQKKVLQLTADYMKAFYNLPVKFNELKNPYPLSSKFSRLTNASSPV